jgi:phosphatidylinositol-3-phosphatase
MTVRSAALAIVAAGFILGHGPVSEAAAPKHVILIMMENHGTDTLFGNKQDAPFLNELIAEPGVRYGTQYYGVTHPSLPNYLALIAGDDMGIHDDSRLASTSNASPRNSSPTPTR